MRYLSVCSGIEAASVAWEPLGWSPVGFSEIEPFPCELLAERFGSNLPNEPLSRNGVPNFGDLSQFRKWPNVTIDLLVGGTPCQAFSVAGLRKGLDDPRGNLTLTYLAVAERYRPEWLVWENVPGVLSIDGGRAFSAFVSGLGKLGYGWAYRVLDAQFVRVDGFPRAVPQRRRRLFVVGHSSGDFRRAASVLLEPEGMRRNSPPRREAGQSVAPTISSRPTGGGGLGTDFDLDGGLIASEIARTRRVYGFDASEDGIGRGTPIAFPERMSGTQYGAMEGVSPALGALNPHAVAYAIQERAVSENPNAGPDGMGVQEGIAYTLEARSQVQALAHPYTLAIRGRGDGHDLEFRQDGTANAVLTPNGGRAGIGVGAIAHGWAVRRLTPTECERLQGFPDGWTDFTRRNGKPAADGPRYKALGNSMAVNVMRWIGLRIALASQVGP